MKQSRYTSSDWPRWYWWWSSYCEPLVWDTKNIMQFLNWCFSRIYSELGELALKQLYAFSLQKLMNYQVQVVKIRNAYHECLFDPQLPYVVHDFSGCKITQRIFKGKDATNAHYQYIVLFWVCVQINIVPQMQEYLFWVVCRSILKSRIVNYKWHKIQETRG